METIFKKKYFSLVIQIYKNQSMYQILTINLYDNDMYKITHITLIMDKPENICCFFNKVSTKKFIMDKILSKNRGDSAIFLFTDNKMNGFNKPIELYKRNDYVHLDEWRVHKFIDLNLPDEKIIDSDLLDPRTFGERFIKILDKHLDIQPTKKSIINNNSVKAVVYNSYISIFIKLTDSNENLYGYMVIDLVSKNRYKIIFIHSQQIEYIFKHMDCLFTLKAVKKFVSDKLKEGRADSAIIFFENRRILDKNNKYTIFDLENCRVDRTRDLDTSIDELPSINSFGTLDPDMFEKRFMDILDKYIELQQDIIV